MKFRLVRESAVPVGGDGGAAVYGGHGGYGVAMESVIWMVHSRIGCFVVGSQVGLYTRWSGGQDNSFEAYHYVGRKR